MSSNLIATRYAKAILTLSETDSSSTDKILKFLEFVAELFKEPEIKKILKSPVIAGDVKAAVLKYAIEKTNAGETAHKFADQIIAASRVALCPQIFEALSKLVDERRGVAKATVTSAERLDNESVPAIEKNLSSVFGKKLTIENKVDTSLLGGFVVEVGNYVIDMSVKAKLEALAEYAQL